MTVIYVQASLNMSTGAAGWGAFLDDGRDTTLGGVLTRDFLGAVTLVELEAVDAAIREAAQRQMIGRGEEIVIAMRSTGTLAVLRWVFPEAEMQGDVEAPKYLRPATRDFQPLFDLHDRVEALGLKVVLRHVGETVDTMSAAQMARIHMEYADSRRGVA